MAKIPSLNGKTRVSKQAPRAISRFQGAGQEGQALQRLGQQITRSGQQVSGAIADLQNRRERAEIADFGNNASFEFRKEINDFNIQEKNRNAGTDHKEYTQRLEAKIAETKERLAQGTDNQDSINHFNDRIRGFSEQQSLQASNYENTERAKYYMGNTLKRVDQLAVDNLDNPDPFNADSELRTLELDMLVGKDVTFNEAQINSIMGAAKQKSRDSVVNGQIRDGMKGLINESMTPEKKKEVVDQFLSGKINGTEFLFDGMNAKEKNIYKKRMDAAIKNIDIREKNEIKELTGNAIALYESGDVLNPNIQNQLLNTKMRLNKLPPSSDKDKMLKAIDNAETVHEFKKGSHTLNTKDLLGADIDNLVGLTGIESGKADIRSRAMIERARNAVVLERNRDGKAYINKHFAGIANDPEASMAQQKELGIMEPRILSKSEATTKAAAILEETNSRDRALAINDVITASGPKYGFQALSEMADENKNFHKGYVYSAFLDDEKVREDVIGAISNRATNKKNFKLTFPPIDVTNLRKTISSELRDEVKAFSKAGLGESAEQFSEMVEAISMERALKDGTTKGVAEKAVKDVIHKNFDIIESGKSTIIMPKMSEQDRTKVEDFIEKSLEPEALKKLGLDKNFYVTGMDDGEFFDRVKEQAFWAMDKDTNGMRLMLKNDRTGITKTLRTGSGAPITMKYEQISSFGELD